MKLTWYGHSAFRIDAGDAKILIDPFLGGNPSWGRGWEGPAEGITMPGWAFGTDDTLAPFAYRRAGGGPAIAAPSHG